MLGEVALAAKRAQISTGPWHARDDASLCRKRQHVAAVAVRIVGRICAAGSCLSGKENQMMRADGHPQNALDIAADQAPQCKFPEHALVVAAHPDMPHHSRDDIEPSFDVAPIDQTSVPL